MMMPPTKLLVSRHMHLTHNTHTQNNKTLALFVYIICNLTIKREKHERTRISLWKVAPYCVTLNNPLFFSKPLDTVIGENRAKGKKEKIENGVRRLAAGWSQL